MNTLSFALLLVLETGLVEPAKTSLSPLRPKRIIGEPLVVSVLLLDGGKSTAKEVPRMHGWWEYREGAGEWRACSRPGTSSAVAALSFDVFKVLVLSTSAVAPSATVVPPVVLPRAPALPRTSEPALTEVTPL